jgi:hypothetical protein
VLDRYRRDTFEHGLAHLLALIGEAVDTLRRNLTCGVPNVEVAAAGKVADIGLKFVELADVTRRLEEIENRLEARKVNP